MTPALRCEKKNKPTTGWLEVDSEDIAQWCYLLVCDTGFSRLSSL